MICEIGGGVQRYIYMYLPIPGTAFGGGAPECEMFCPTLDTEKGNIRLTVDNCQRQTTTAL